MESLIGVVSGKYVSDESDFNGAVAKRRDRMVRVFLSVAANALLTRVSCRI
ncbi:hypothetical protein [Thiocapsa bogorovii]|uniref:hypothetical protein n=1 Tax=Thiocapsa bogorovii TaxID=521689 RepID=UPI001E562A77|nr:hypothetical protein [Thiocapsa bogorovii]UHD14770.1 hypothetical protein LT988_15930 [Thiocapsa bogorovii]